MPPVRKLPRHIKLPAKIQSADNKRETVERSEVRHIQSHPQYELILRALREGVSAPDIARYMAENQLLDISEKVFVAYIYTFRRRHPELIRVDPLSPDAEIDAMVDGQQPNVDVELELSRLYRLQKLRLGIDVRTEKRIDKLFNTTVKEVRASREILETLARVQGKIGRSNDGISDGSMLPETRSSLNSLREDEQKRDAMNSLTSELIGALSNARQRVSD